MTIYITKSPAEAGLLSFIKEQELHSVTFEFLLLHLNRTLALVA